MYKSRSRYRSLVPAATVVAAFAVQSASAAPTLFKDGIFTSFVESAAGQNGGPSKERAEFAAFTNNQTGALVNQRSESFEGFTVPPPAAQGGKPVLPSALSFGTGATVATLSSTAPVPPQGFEPLADGVVGDDFSPGSGRLNTTAGGSKFLLVAYSFSLDFGAPISALGLFGTDFGDFDGILTLVLTKSQGGTVDPIPVAPTLTGNGTLAFLGFVDTTGTTYSRVSFTIAYDPARFPTPPEIDARDRLGFDDLIVGNWQIGAPNGAPEPGSLALACASLLALAGVAARRRR